MTTKPMRGVYPILVTPFDEAGRIVGVELRQCLPEQLLETPGFDCQVDEAVERLALIGRMGHEKQDGLGIDRSPELLSRSIRCKVRDRASENAAGLCPEKQWGIVAHMEPAVLAILGAVLLVGKALAR